MNRQFSSLIVTFLFSVFSMAQDRHKLTFEVGYNFHLYSMKKFNESYINSPSIKNNYKLDEINTGKGFNAGIKFKPIGLFDIGISGNYQVGKTSSNPELIETDEFGNPIQTHIGEFKFTAESIGIGISNSWYISHFFRFHEKSNFLNRSHIALEIYGGFGFSKITSDLRYPTFPPLYGTGYKFYTSNQDFQGQIALRLEYNYVKSPVIGSIGIKGGYQYFKTKTVKDRLGKEWIVTGNHPINLDFSGFFGTVFLTVGR